MWLGVASGRWSLAASWASRVACQPAGMPPSGGVPARLQGMRAGRAEWAVAERLDDIPAATGTALTGQALTSFDSDGIRNPPAAWLDGAFGRARQDQQARIAPGLMT